MKRKEFLISAGILGAAPFVSGMSTTKKDQKSPNQYVELIRYHLHPGEKKSLVSDFYKDVAIPALNRIGIPQVGVFTPVYGPDNLTLFVLVPHASLDAVYSDNEKLMQDKVYLKDGEKFLNPSINDAPFVRMEKSVFRAFDGLPAVEAPTDMMSNSSRIYEIRMYESPGFVAAKKKIQMFNEGGEIAIFKRTGLRPVFFGECLSGPQMPVLNYMLVFNNMQERDANWANFGKDPDWGKLKKDPYYADVVSCITDIILRPAAFSQI